jgi:hypothetical protein
MRTIPSLLLFISLTALSVQALSLDPKETSRTAIKDHITSKAFKPKNVQLGINIVDISITTTHKQDRTNYPKIRELNSNKEPNGKPMRIIRNPNSTSPNAKKGEKDVRNFFPYKKSFSTRARQPGRSISKSRCCNPKNRACSSQRQCY